MGVILLFLAIFVVSAQWNLLTVQILSQVGSGRLGVAGAFSVILIIIFLGVIAVIAKIIPGREGDRAERTIRPEGIRIMEVTKTEQAPFVGTV